jgi:hypothetical protein
MLTELDSSKAHQLSRADFVAQFESTSRPCLLHGLLSDWPAFNGAWSPDVLAVNTRDIKFDLGLDGDAVESRMSIDEFIQKMVPSESMDASGTIPPPIPYIFDADYGETMPALLEDYHIPAMFASDKSDYLAFLSENSSVRPRYRWLLLGAAGSGFTIHQDPFDSCAWNAMVHGGFKRWLLLPENIPVELVLPLTTQTDSLPEQESTASAWFSNVYPTLRQRAVDEFGISEQQLGLIEFEQHPGDVVFIPRGWWHVALTLPTESNSLTVAVTQNYMSRFAFQLAVQRMAARNPEAARAWCQRVIDGCDDDEGRELAQTLISTMAT